MYVLGDGRWQIMCKSSAHMLGDRETSMNQIEFLSFRAYGLSFQVLTQGKNKTLLRVFFRLSVFFFFQTQRVFFIIESLLFRLLWLKVWPKDGWNQQVCMVYKSQKLVKHISFVKEATDTTGLEAQKTRKAYGNWAKTFF